MNQWHARTARGFRISLYLLTKRFVLDFYTFDFVTVHKLLVYTWFRKRLYAEANICFTTFLNKKKCPFFQQKISYLFTSVFKTSWTSLWERFHYYFFFLNSFSPKLIHSGTFIYIIVIQHWQLMNIHKSKSRYLPNQTEIHCQNSTWFDYWHSF